MIFVTYIHQSLVPCGPNTGEANRIYIILIHVYTLRVRRTNICAMIGELMVYASEI